jgi:hypothetical protein
MTKMQKVWLGIFLAIVLAPEILFQSTARLIYGVFTIKDITFGHAYTLVLVQSLAALVSSIFMFVLRKKLQCRWLCYLLIVFFILWAVVGYLAYDTALHAIIEFRGF